METLKDQFPFFAAHPQCVYLDSAATTQVPQTVIDATSSYLAHDHAAVGRGLYAESLAASAAVEAARGVVREFVNAPALHDVVFTGGATAALNQIAWGLQGTVQKGDTIVIALDNHHANFLPWQRLARANSAKLITVEIDPDGSLNHNSWQQALASKPRVVALSHASNVTGTLHPIETLTTEAKAAGAITIVDGAQAVAHTDVDITAIGCDFYVFSGHKLYAPTGIGCIIGNHELLNQFEPLIVGGGIITQVTKDTATWDDSPTRHEAGTPNTAGIAGLVAAINWFTANRDAIFAAERDLIDYIVQQLATLPDISLFGSATATNRVGVFSFMVDGRHAHDVAHILAENGVAVRTGHHCAQPLHTHFNVPATTRISLGAYSTREDSDAALTALTQVVAQIPKRTE